MKLTSELCMQLTTLGTAGALIVIAVYRELSFGETLLAATLVLFGVTIMISLIRVAANVSYYARAKFIVDTSPDVSLQSPRSLEEPQPFTSLNLS